MRKNLPKHASTDQFPVENNCLQIGGIPITKLAEDLGSTPFFAYDRELIRQRITTLRNVLPDSLGLHYAIKANPMPELVTEMAGLTDGLDVASLAEMELALKAGIPAQHISFAGPGKSENELTAAVKSGVIINMESENELHRISDIGQSTGIKPVVAVRVNPAFELKNSGMQMGGGAKPFGIDEELVPGILQQRALMEMDFKGFHIFCGSQNLNTDAILEAQERTIELALNLADLAPQPVSWLNIGGGLGIPYFPGETRLNIDAIGENLAGLSEQLSSRLGNIALIMELGRFLVGEAGIYVSRIIDKKRSRGETFLVTDGGLHHHLPASGNFGQVIRKNYPVCLGNKVTGNQLEKVNIVGRLCTPLDILASRVELPEANIGDFVVIFQSGAYACSASPHDFLSHPLPQQILV